MARIFIIGDVHGCYKTLMALVKQLPKDAKLVFVGDLIDRGSDSQKVIEFVRKNNHLCVMGNHELTMRDEGVKVMKDPKEIATNRWTDKKQNYGGLETLISYRKLKTIFGFSNPTKMYKDDIEWIKSLPTYLEFPDLKDANERYLVVTHSTVHDQWYNRVYPNGTKERSEFDQKVLFSRVTIPKDNTDIFNVFGHTPVALPVVTEYFANIDTGCVYSYPNRKHSLGILTALEFPSKKIYNQENIDLLNNK